MSERIIVITGGSRGIGRALVERFSSAGDQVIFFHHREGSGADTIKGCESHSGSVEGRQVDVSDFQAIIDAIGQIVSEKGRVDVLINNAGVTRDNLMMRLDEEAWDQVLDTNLKGAFAATKAVTRAMMKARKGTIINISSVVGLTGNAGQTNYAASKSGLLGLTKSVAKELSPRNITCNAICPGFIETDMTGQLDDDQKKNLHDAIPLNRLGKPEDVAEAAFFLASEAASYMTGQSLNVDGGMVM